jgi:hypothetical protein
MNDAPHIPASIKPEMVALKLAAAQNFAIPNFAEQLLTLPRLAEALWHVQAMSLRPGGLPKFAQDFLAAYPDRIGTRAFFALGKKRGAYSKNEQKQIGESVPRGIHHLDEQRDSEERERAGAPNWPFVFPPKAEMFSQFCQEQAQARFASFLEAMFTAEDKAIRAPWYFPAFFEALFDYMDGHAAAASERLAQTEIVKQVFDALDYAADQKALVQIFGQSRFGKSEAVNTWCEMRPGKARRVLVPCSSIEADLFRAIADAYGIPHNFHTKARELKEKIEFIARVSPLMIVFDEAHFLLPVNFSSTTNPARLNWIRTQLVDRRVPVVLVSTPQDFKRQSSKFVKATQYNFAQFAGRNMLTVNLPEELSQADLIAAAQIHFPELDANYLELIAAKAMQSESYLQAVEAIAKRAQWIARREKHDSMTLPDLNLAIEEVTGSRLATVAPDPRPATPLPRVGSRSAAPMPMPARNVRPVTIETPDTVNI